MLFFVVGCGLRVGIRRRHLSFMKRNGLHGIRCVAVFYLKAPWKDPEYETGTWKNIQSELGWRRRRRMAEGGPTMWFLYTI